MPEEKVMEVEKQVAIVVVCYNNLAYTRICIEAVLKNTTVPYSLFVVDNASKDKTIEYLKEARSRKNKDTDYCKSFTIIDSKVNKGFAGGNNLALSRIRGNKVYSHILLLNNDTLPGYKYIERMQEVFQIDARIGLVGPRSNYVGGSQWISNCPARPESAENYAEIYYETNKGKHFQSGRLIGFCLLMKCEVLEKVGLLDEIFIKGMWEDNDYALRCRAEGYLSWVAGDVFMYHFGGKTIGSEMNNLFESNKQVFYKKWAELNKINEHKKIVGMLRVKDGAPYLPETLKEVSKMVDEIVVFNDHSTDNTEEICRGFKKVVEFYNSIFNTFDEARDRNYLLNMAKERQPDWIYSIDADEVPENRLIKNIQIIVNNPNPEIKLYAFQICHLWNNDKNYRIDGLWGNFLQGRLFKNEPFQTIVGNDEGLHCFTGDTQIPLVNGYSKSIKELAEMKDLNGLFAYSTDLQNKQITYGKINKAWKTGIKEVIKITLDNDESFKCTPDHLIMLRDGEYKKAGELKENDSLMPLYRRWDVTECDGYELLYYSLEDKWHFSHRQFWKQANFNQIQRRGEVIHHRDYNKKNNVPLNLKKMLNTEHAFFHSKKRTPEHIEKLNKVNGSKKKRDFLIKYSKERMANLPKEIVLQMSLHGRIAASSEQARKNLSISNKKYWGSLSNEQRKEKLKQNIARWTPERREQARIDGAKAHVHALNHKVIKIESCGIEDVYDMEIDKYHNFAIGFNDKSGIFVHNCGSHPHIPIENMQLVPYRIKHYGNMEPRTRMQKYLFYTRTDKVKDVGAILGGWKNWYTRLYQQLDNLAKGKDMTDKETSYVLKEEDYYRHIVNEATLKTVEWRDGIFVSLPMIVCNEEATIEKALESVKDFADEIIIIDTGSTDDTIEIAKKYTDKIYKYSWTDSFSEARNYGLSLCKGDWILRLDADEELPADTKSLWKIMFEDEAELIMFSIHNYMQDPSKHKATYSLSKTVRLFKHLPELKYDLRVHEELEASINKLAETKTVRMIHAHQAIAHYGYLRDKDKLKEKYDYYARLSQMDLKENPKNFRPYYNLATHYYHNGYHVEAEKLYRKAIEINPKLWMAWHDLGILLYRRALKKVDKEFAEAKKLFDKAKEVLPKGADENYVQRINKNVKIVEDLIHGAYSERRRK